MYTRKFATVGVMALGALLVALVSLFELPFQFTHAASSVAMTEQEMPTSINETLGRIAPARQVVVQKELLEPSPLVGPALELKQVVGEPTKGKLSLLRDNYCSLSSAIVNTQPTLGWGENTDETDEQSRRFFVEHSDLRAEAEFLYDKIARAEFPQGSDYPEFFYVVELNC